MTRSRPSRDDNRRDRDRAALVAGLLAPVAVAAALVPLRDRVANTSVALLLVLAVVGVAMSGRRTAGFAAAVSASVAFDFFWTPPYETLAIRAADDVETAILLLLVGAAITEIVAWSRRQQAAADREAGYRDGVLAAAEAVASGDAPSRVIDRVAGQMVPLLGLDRCRFDYGTGLDQPATRARRQRGVAPPDARRRRRRLPLGAAHRAAGRGWRAVPGAVPAHRTARCPTDTHRAAGRHRTGRPGRGGTGQLRTASASVSTLGTPTPVGPSPLGGDATAHPPAD